MAFFDFETLEEQVDSVRGGGTVTSASGSSTSSRSRGTESQTSRPRPAPWKPPILPADDAAAVPPTARPPPPRPPSDALWIALKMYSSSDVQEIGVPSSCTVEGLRCFLLEYHGFEWFEAADRLVGSERGARTRHAKRARGWALEKYAAVDPCARLMTLGFGALVVHRRREGPMAELDLQEIAERAEKKRRAKEAKELAKLEKENAYWWRAADVKERDENAQQDALRAEAESHMAEEAHAAEEARRAAEGNWPVEETLPVASDWNGYYANSGHEEELLAQALEIELEVERRRRQEVPVDADGELGAKLRIAPVAPRGTFVGPPYFSTVLVLFVDAMNEALNKIRQTLAASIKHAPRAVEEGLGDLFQAFTNCLAKCLQCRFPRRALSHIEGLQRVFVRQTTGVCDAVASWCGVLAQHGTAFQRRNASISANNGSDRELAVAIIAEARKLLHMPFREALRLLRAALEASHQDISARNRAEAFQLLQHVDRLLASWRSSTNSMARSVGTLPAELRLVRTTDASMARLLFDLRARFKDGDFQRRYHELPRGEPRVLLALSVQSAILPNYGFSGDPRGVANMRKEVGWFQAMTGDRVIWKLMKDIHQLLDIKDTHADVFTLDFGSANNVEHEISGLFQQELTLTNLEKLVAARLAAASARGWDGGLHGNVPGRAAIELICARLSGSEALLHTARDIASLSATARELYVATGGLRRQLAIDSVHRARTLRRVRSSLLTAEALMLGQNPSIVTRRRALATLDNELVRCFQNQPELDTSTLVRRWQDGEQTIDAVEEGGASALHLTAGDGHVDLVRSLLAVGACVDLQDRLGRTPAHWAAARSDAVVLAALAAGGANLELPDVHGRTPWNIAKAAKLEHCIAELRVWFTEHWDIGSSAYMAAWAGLAERLEHLLPPRNDTAQRHSNSKWS